MKSTLWSVLSKPKFSSIFLNNLLCSFFVAKINLLKNLS